MILPSRRVDTRPSARSRASCCDTVGWRRLSSCSSSLTDFSPSARMQRMTSRLSCASALRKSLARLALSTMRSSSCGRPRVSSRCNSMRVRSTLFESEPYILLAHDLIRKSVPTFRDHALAHPSSRSRGARLQTFSRLRALFFQTAARVLHPLWMRPAFSSARRASPRSDPHRDNRGCGRFHGRIRGYPGEDHFWGLLGELMKKLDASTTGGERAQLFEKIVRAND